MVIIVAADLALFRFIFQFFMSGFNMFYLIILHYQYLPQENHFIFVV